jgi:nucleotide-binding universal stress UspA family protein
MRRVVMTEDEARRMLAEQTRGIVDPERVRLLLPVSENPNSAAAAALAAGLARRSQSPVVIFHADVKTTIWERLLHPFSKPQKDSFDRALSDVREHLGETPSTVRRTTATTAGSGILEELGKGFDAVVLGASADAMGSHLAGHAVEDVVRHAGCHVIIVKGRNKDVAFKRIFVPVDGSLVSRAATEVAVRYAETTGASITLGLTVERRGVAQNVDTTGGTGATLPGVTIQPASTPDALERITPLFKTSMVKPIVQHIEHTDGSSALITAVTAGDHDLVVVGAENRAIQHTLYFGHDTERLIRKAAASIAIVVPAIAEARMH